MSVKYMGLTASKSRDKCSDQIKPLILVEKIKVGKSTRKNVPLLFILIYYNTIIC